MTDVPSYLHVMDGRLRVKVPEIKRSVQKALHVEGVLASLEGVIRVTANPTTGNVLVLFHSHLLTHAAIIQTLRQSDYLRAQTTVVSTVRFTEHMVDTVSHAIARSVAEVVMERALLALL
jgi:copper chaperone CopZ